MKDKEFLQWIEARLIQVHGESPNVDYMHKLRAIIDATNPDKVTPNIVSVNQCDGCRREMPLVDGIHKAEGYDMIGCTKHLYNQLCTRATN